MIVLEKEPHEYELVAFVLILKQHLRVIKSCSNCATTVRVAISPTSHE